MATNTVRGTRPLPAALLGALFALPFVALNLTVVFHIEPLFSVIRPGVHTGPFEYPILIIALLLLPAGAAVALAPAWRRGTARRPPVANIVTAVLLVVSFVALAVPLGSDIVRCEVMQVKNCD